MIKQIVEDEKILATVCEKVIDFKNIKSIVKDMIDTLVSTFNTSNSGIAIAAPQINVLKNIVVVDVTDLYDKEDATISFGVYVNPKIIEKRGRQVYWEGCLSSPLKSGKVERPYYIKIEYEDINGVKKFEEFEDFYAIVLCHEIDHLNGITYDKIAIKVVDHKSEQEKLDFRLQMASQEPHTIISKE